MAIGVTEMRSEVKDVPTVKSGTKPAALECRGLEVVLTGSAGAVTILRDINLQVGRGEFVSILGASGSGKTTLLRALGGLQEASSGSVEVPGARHRAGGRVVTVFQDYAHSLLPWRKVRRNVSLGLESSLGKVEREARVAECLEMVGLTESADEYPWRLSGGMQQRVQIARAIAMKPEVLLMDEPFGALDAMTKASLQDSLQRIQAETETTIVFVTHDIDEAVYLSDRVVVLDGKPGSIALEETVSLARPRDQVTTREHPHYLALRHKIYEAIGRGSSA